jgi:hypothetical protein
MTDAALPSLPPTGRLFGDAFAHWRAHQLRFWKFTVPVALLLASVPYFMMRGWIPQVLPWVESGVRAFVDVLILYQWFNYALYDDWSVRRGRLLQQKKFPWGAFLSVGFVAFWALHFALSYGLISAWRQAHMPVPMIVQLTIVPLKEIVLAIVFGGFMLYLPAKVAGLSWSPLEAWREAGGLRGRLIAVAVLWAILSLVALNVIDELTWFAGSTATPGLPSERTIILLDFASSVLGIATDFLMYYLLAFSVARLFVARTGWTPRPLPA